MNYTQIKVAINKAVAFGQCAELLGTIADSYDSFTINSSQFTELVELVKQKINHFAS